jgi:DNA-binding transcriptional MerR regulator
MSIELGIGAVSREFGVSAEYLRMLERRRLIPPPRRNAAGRRIYDESDLKRLQVLRIGQRPRRLQRLDDVMGVVE